MNTLLTCLVFTLVLILINFGMKWFIISLGIIFIGLFIYGVYQFHKGMKYYEKKTVAVKEYESLKNNPKPGKHYLDRKNRICRHVKKKNRGIIISDSQYDAMKDGVRRHDSYHEKGSWFDWYKTVYNKRNSRYNYSKDYKRFSR